MKYKCTNCGHVFEGKEPFCSQCGKKMEYGEEPEQSSLAVPFQDEPVYNQSQPITEDVGNYGVGFILGFFLGLLGMIIALVLNKKETIRGAITGLVVSFVGSIFFIFFLVLILW